MLPIRRADVDHVVQLGQPAIRMRLGGFIDSFSCLWYIYRSLSLRLKIALRPELYYDLNCTTI